MRARRLRYKCLCLDTKPAGMADAVRLYVRFGFVECPPYRVADPGVRFFRYEL